MSRTALAPNPDGVAKAGGTVSELLACGLDLLDIPLLLFGTLWRATRGPPLQTQRRALEAQMACWFYAISSNLASGFFASLDFGVRAILPTLTPSVARSVCICSKQKPRAKMRSTVSVGRFCNNCARRRAANASLKFAKAVSICII